MKVSAENCAKSQAARSVEHCSKMIHEALSLRHRMSFAPLILVLRSCCWSSRLCASSSPRLPHLWLWGQEAFWDLEFKAPWTVASLPWSDISACQSAGFTIQRPSLNYKTAELELKSLDMGYVSGPASIIAS